MQGILAHWPRREAIRYEAFVRDADTALAAIEAAGFALCPLEPTEEMPENAAHEEDKNECADIYRAMIAARPKPE